MGENVKVGGREGAVAPDKWGGGNHGMKNGKRSEHATQHANTYLSQIMLGEGGRWRGERRRALDERGTGLGG